MIKKKTSNPESKIFIENIKRKNIVKMEGKVIEGEKSY